MAGEWIPYTKGLAKRREIALLADATGKARNDVVVALLEFWSWCDDESEDGTLPGMSIRNLSALHADICPHGDQTFFAALCGIGWLVEEADCIVIPHFARWMGRSAKKRLRDNQRKKVSRLPDQHNPTSNGEMSASEADKCPHADRKKTPLQDKTYKEPPPTPSEGGGKGGDVASLQEEKKPVASLAPVQQNTSANFRGTAADNPELFAVAKRIVSHYMKTVAPAQPRSGAERILIPILQGGLSEDSLLRSCDGFAAFCIKSGRPPDKRPSPRSFFEKGLHDEYLDYQPAKPARKPNPTPSRKPGEGLSAMAEAIREVRSRTPANAPGSSMDASKPIAATTTPTSRKEAI